MKREEALKILKEIFDECTFYDGNWIALMPPNAASLLSHGYQVHLKIPLDSDSRICMEDVLKKYALGFMYREEAGLTIIYRPKDGTEGVN